MKTTVTGRHVEITAKLDAMTPEQDRAPVLVFRRAGSDDVNIVYRTADGSVAWIDPAR